MNGFCKFGKDCAFAHGFDELKERKLSNNYKTKPCNQFFEFGYCPYGNRCQFSHKMDLKKIIRTIWQKPIKYKDILRIKNEMFF